jgi:hypothetical protein
VSGVASRRAESRQPQVRRRRWAGRAFGIPLDSEVPLPGTSHLSRVERDERPLRIERADEETLRSAWSERARRNRPLQRKEGPDGRLVTTIDSDPDAGYLFEARGVAVCRIDSDVDVLEFAPEAEFDSLRYLGGQVLPFASVLRGFEVFHASAVAWGDRAFAFIGPSGAGKSTIALNLTATGAVFLTDDVLAVSEHDGGAFAHPGLALAKARHSARRLLPGFGLPEPFAWAEDAALLPVGGAERAYRLAGVFLLKPAVEGSGPKIAEVGGPRAEALLASTFNFVLDTPARLANQLAVCGAIGEGAALYTVDLPNGPDGAAIAAIRNQLGRARRR